VNFAVQEYLHFYCDPSLCHGDIKSSNVLLDSSFLAKVLHGGKNNYHNEIFSCCYSIIMCNFSVGF
jgi:hypothetical protein